MKYPRLALLSSLLVLASTGLLHAQNQIPNPGFESGNSDWSIFIPSGSTNDNCKFTVSTDSPHTGTSCAELKSDDYSRYAISPTMDFHPNPGEKYHVIAWVKADPTTEVKPGQPGIVIRITLQLNGKDTAGGHFYIGLDSVVTRGANPPSLTPSTSPAPAAAAAPAAPTSSNTSIILPTSTAPAASTTSNPTPTPVPPVVKLPTEWTKMEGDFTMPDDADSAYPQFFGWYTKGPVYFDDVSIEKVQ